MRSHTGTALFLGVLALTLGGVAHKAVAGGYKPPEFSGVVGVAVNGWGTIFEPKCSGYRNFVIHWGDGTTSPPRATSPATPGITISGTHIYQSAGVYRGSVDLDATCTNNLGMRYHASVKGTPGGYPLGFIVLVAEAEPVSPPIPLPPPAEAKKRFTEPEKTALRQLSRFAKTQAKVNAVIAIVLAFDPDPSVSKIGAAASGGGAVVYESIGDYADDLYNDPPDPNFKTVAAPAVLRVPHMRGTDVKSTAIATAINRYHDAVAHRASIYRALLTAIERAQGAAIARSPVYERRQMLAAAALASSLANDSNKFIATSGAAVQAFVRAGDTLNVTKPVADRAQQVVGKSGLPPAFSAALAQFGPDAAAALRRQLVGGLETARGRFPQIIADPNALKTYRAEAAALRAFVRHVNANPTAAAP